MGADRDARHGTGRDALDAAADGRALAAAVRAVLARVDAHARRAAKPTAPTAPPPDSGSGAGGDAGVGAGGGGGAAGEPDRARAGAEPPAPARQSAPPAVPAGPPALDALVACFGLSPFERELILLTAAAELEPTAGSRCAAACGDRTGRTRPSRSRSPRSATRTGARSRRSRRCAAGGWWSWTTRHG
ncbi:hypothetical protein NKH77_40170 [Streptomyces sp. M19]